MARQAIWASSIIGTAMMLGVTSAPVQAETLSADSVMLQSFPRLPKLPKVPKLPQAPKMRLPNPEEAAISRHIGNSGSIKIWVNIYLKSDI